MSRRPARPFFMYALAAWALLSALPVNGAFAAYPEKTIRIVVPFAPGGGTDVIARTLAQEMAKDLGATIIIENKPGAGTIIGTQTVAASEPDGYTLLMGTFANAVTSAQRSPAFPELPTVAEAAVPGYAAESWYGLYAPAKTPAAIIERLNKSAARAVQSDAFKKLGVNEGLVMVASEPAELDRYVRGEEERWRKVIHDANIRID